MLRFEWNRLIKWMRGIEQIIIIRPVDPVRKKDFTASLACFAQQHFHRINPGVPPFGKHVSCTGRNTAGPNRCVSFTPLMPDTIYLIGMRIDTAHVVINNSFETIFSHPLIPEYPVCQDIVLENNTTTSIHCLEVLVGNKSIDLLTDG